MVRILIRAGIFVGSAALGLLVAMLLLPEVTLSWSGMLVAVLVFAILQSIIGPFFIKIASRRAPVFLGGAGIVSTFLALFVSSLFPGGLEISGWRAWVLATILVWLVTACATFFLPKLFLKDTANKKHSRRAKTA